MTKEERLEKRNRKTNLLLEYLLNMPSEIGLFDIKYNDFKVWRKDK